MSMNTSMSEACALISVTFLQQNEKQLALLMQAGRTKQNTIAAKTLRSETVKEQGDKSYTEIQYLFLFEKPIASTHLQFLSDLLANGFLLSLKVSGSIVREQYGNTIVNNLNLTI